MSREAHVRICEGLGVKLPGATRLVMGFQYQNEAERFLQALRERMAKFGLELHQEKTRLIEFGRFAAANRAARGEVNRKRSISLDLRTYARRPEKVIVLPSAGKP